MSSPRDTSRGGGSLPYVVTTVHLEPPRAASAQPVGAFGSACTESTIREQDLLLLQPTLSMRHGQSEAYGNQRRCGPRTSVLPLSILATRPVRLSPLNAEGRACSRRRRSQYGFPHSSQWRR